LIGNKIEENDELIVAYPQKECYACGKNGLRVYSNLIDRTYGYGSLGKWNLNKCVNPDCKLFWLDPMPSIEDIGKAYKSYYTNTEMGPTILPFFNPLIKGYLNLEYGYYSDSITIYEKILGSLLYLLPTEKVEVDFSVMYLHSKLRGKLLDVGCGNGWFLKKMKDLKWEVMGVDFDSAAVDFCKSQDFDVRLGTLQSQNYPENYFDVITINHVIEHVHDPFELIIESKRILKKNGLLIIETPNTNSWLHKYIFKENWFPLEPPRHLLMFNPTNLGNLVRKAGFQRINSKSTSRNDSWAFVVSTAIKRNGFFKVGKEKSPKFFHLFGRIFQLISWAMNLFNKDIGGEVVLIAKK
jgi:2-polyprenyl-3-methyl-5-hydroxy-6-metoxy-1,4-benzoquinol methylase